MENSDPNKKIVRSLFKTITMHCVSNQLLTTNKFILLIIYATNFNNKCANTRK